MKSEFVSLDVEGNRLWCQHSYGIAVSYFFSEGVHLFRTRGCNFFETVSAGRCKHLEAERRDLIHLDCNTKHVEGRRLVKHV